MGPEMGPKSERNYKPRRSDLERTWVQTNSPTRAKRGPKSVPQLIEKRGPKKGGGPVNGPAEPWGQGGSETWVLKQGTKK